MPAGIYKRTDKHLAQLAEARNLIPRLNLTAEQKRQRNTLQKAKSRMDNPEHARKMRRKWSRENPDKIQVMSRKWREENKDRYAKYQQEYRQEQKVSGKWRRYYLMKKYGLTPERYDEILLAQKHKCAICGLGQSNFERKLFVDHDHGTKVVRGILCGNCNLLLGYSKDSVDILKQAIKYLDHAN